MEPIDRRQFLRASGVVGAGALLAGAVTVTVEQLFGRAATDPMPAGERILVLLTLYGGNDGVNTVVPYADPTYQDLRPELAYDAADVLDLGEGLGLNPSLPGLKKLWDAGDLAVVRGVGYPKPDHSHFRSMDIWQTASPDRPVGTGWIGRWLDTRDDDPLLAVNVGAVLPPLAVGEHATASALDLGRGKPLTPVLADALTVLAVTDPAYTATDLLVPRSCAAERKVSATFDPIVDAAGDPDDDPSSAAGSAGGQGELDRQLALVARCVKAGVPTKVYCVSLGGFDTHADEKGTQEALMASLDRAVSGFLASLAGDPRGAGVVVAAYSEFGRRLAANASQGTDHGTAGPVLLVGPGVKGGFHGEQPSLTDLDDGDLKATVDFRRVYADLLTGCLDAEPEKVLGSAYEPLGLLA